MAVKTWPMHSPGVSRSSVAPFFTPRNGTQLDRRAFLSALGGMLALGAFGPGDALAAKHVTLEKEDAAEGEGATAAPSGKLVRIDRGTDGVTLTFALANAPFPLLGAPYEDRSVLVFVPHHYRLPKDRRLDALIHFHGHNNTAEGAVHEHALREQLAESKQNAILIAPQGPVRAADSNGGKLEHKGGLRRMTDELARELAKPSLKRILGPSATTAAKSFGTVCLSAHSGGYRVAAACLMQGEVEVTEVYLFDALYGAGPSFRAWLKAGGGKRRHHKLISTYATPPVRANNLVLMAELRADGFNVLHELKPGELSRKALTDGRAIFIASPLDHGGVTHRHNNLRDCLYASQLHRHQKSDWFDNKNAARQIDSR